MAYMPSEGTQQAQHERRQHSHLEALIDMLPVVGHFIWLPGTDVMLLMTLQYSTQTVEKEQGLFHQAARVSRHSAFQSNPTQTQTRVRSISPLILRISAGARHAA